jgi:hypothetical protein
VSRERVYLFDTTLRDGAQTQGVDFSVEDKRTIAQALDGLGIDYVEGGWPGANPTDTAFFHEELALNHARFTAFGMTKKSGRSAANDPGLAALLSTKAPALCLVGKSWTSRSTSALEIPRGENLDNISESIAAVVARKREALFDAEHFFDGYRANTDYALSALRAALDAGASWLVLCDTNGGTLPEDAYRIVSEVKGAPAERQTRRARPQRHGAGGGRESCGAACGCASNPGHAERAWRALRQRQSVLGSGDADAQRALRLAIRNRRVDGAAREVDGRVAAARRNPQSRAASPRGLCRAVRVCAQRRLARLRGAEESAHL